MRQMQNPYTDELFEVSGCFVRCGTPGCSEYGLDAEVADVPWNEVICGGCSSVLSPATESFPHS